MTSTLVGILTGIVAFAVSIPLLGSMIRNKERRHVGIALALLIGIGAGLVAGRLVRSDTSQSPPPVEGT